MAAQGFIVAYFGVWAAWSSLVGAILDARSGRLGPLGFASCGSILVFALAPVLGLSFAARYTSWIASGTNEILSLATPPSLMLFVTTQLRRLAAEASDAGEPPRSG